MAVPVRVSTNAQTLEPGKPIPLFRKAIVGGGLPRDSLKQQYLVAPDGQRLSREHDDQRGKCIADQNRSELDGRIDEVNALSSLRRGSQCTNPLSEALSSTFGRDGRRRVRSRPAVVTFTRRRALVHAPPPSRTTCCCLLPSTLTPRRSRWAA